MFPWLLSHGVVHGTRWQPFYYWSVMPRVHTNSLLVFFGERELSGTGPRNNWLSGATINDKAGENLASNYLETPLKAAHLQVGCEGEGLGVRVWCKGECE